MTLERTGFAVVAVLWASATLGGQTVNSASGPESAQGWQLLFDGKTLAGWHVSAPPPGRGRTGPPPPPQPGQVGTPKPCVTAGAAAAPAGGSHWEIVGTAKTARPYAFRADQWNLFQITADGDHLVVELNGETTLDIQDGAFSEGHLRLQYQQFPIAFRNIKIRSLP